MDGIDSVKFGVEKVVQEIVARDGEIKPTILLEHAKDKKSPAHNGFEWDNKKAGHQFRLIQARNWLRIVVVKAVDEESERLVHVPAVVDETHSSQEGTYKPLSVVVETPDEYIRARNECLSKGRAFAHALNELDTAAGRVGKSDVSAVIAQLSRGLDLFEKAIDTMH